jgi:hypothetical protein
MSAISLAELLLSKLRWATISELLTSIVIFGAVNVSIEVVNADSITVTLEALFLVAISREQKIVIL